jgi:hypothetical protein
MHVETRATSARAACTPRSVIATAALCATAAAALAVGPGRPAGVSDGGRGCQLTVRPYEDGSASLYCDRERDPIGRVDADTGTVALFPSTTRRTGPAPAAGETRRAARRDAWGNDRVSRRRRK